MTINGSESFPALNFSEPAWNTGALKCNAMSDSSHASNRRPDLSGRKARLAAVPARRTPGLGLIWELDVRPFIGRFCPRSDLFAVRFEWWLGCCMTDVEGIFRCFPRRLWRKH
jgi:hypothetical protein